MRSYDVAGVMRGPFLYARLMRGPSMANLRACKGYSETGPYCFAGGGGGGGASAVGGSWAWLATAWPRTWSEPSSEKSMSVKSGSGGDDTGDSVQPLKRSS